MTPTKLYGAGVAGIWHVIARSVGEVRRADEALRVVGLCGHQFRLVAENYERPSDKLLCYGCLAKEREQSFSTGPTPKKTEA